MKVRAGSERGEVACDPLRCLVTERDSEIFLMAGCWVVGRERLGCSKETRENGGGAWSSCTLTILQPFHKCQ